MVTIKNNQYIMENARRKQELMEFLLAITKTIKKINIPVYNQIIFLYTGIKLKFRRDLFKPIENSIINSYFQEL